METVSEDPRVVLLHQALRPQVCARIIDVARPRIAPAKVWNAEGKMDEIADLRRSQSVFFPQGHDATIELIGMACRLSGLPKANVEPVQVVRYLEGGFYAEHHDAFRMDGTILYDHTGGQRVWSLVAYLQSPEAGGLTVFRDLELGIEPIVGNAVAWNNLQPDGQIDTRLMHESAPVERGEKWAAVCWVRERAWSLSTPEVQRAS